MGKPRTVLIDGPLVLQDKSNSLKTVVKFSGLLKQNNLCGAEFIANSKQSKNIVQGLVYKYDQKIIEQYIKKKKTRKVEKITDLFDVECKLQRITGSAIDFYEIEGAPHGDWFNVPLADPIP